MCQSLSQCELFMELKYGFQKCSLYVISFQFIGDEELVETIKGLSSVGSVRKEHTMFTDTHL